MAKLRLGPILDDKPVKRTIQLTAQLDVDLAAYAEVYATEFGQALAVERLIPAMLEKFLRSDRGFRRQVGPSARKQDDEPAATTKMSPSPSE